MRLSWVEGQAWIESPFYEGPHDLLLFFAQKSRISWMDLSLREILDASAKLLPALSMEERMELLVFLSHLLRLKAVALLPYGERLPQAEEGSETYQAPNGSQGFSAFREGPLLAEWERRIARAQYFLARPASPEEQGEKVIIGLTQMRLVRAYEEVLLRLRKRHSVHRVAPLPFVPEEVEQELQNRFLERVQWVLQELWETLRPHPLYRAMAFLFLLAWIQEGRVGVEISTPWQVVLSWRA